MPSPARSITVLYFAAALTAVGADEETVMLPEPEAPSATEGLPLLSLASLLCERHPGVQLEKILRGSRWSVDEEMVEDEETVILKGGEVVAVICPVSGG